MPAMTLSSKRQVVLPSDLCRQLALKPGAKIDVSLFVDGSGILIRPAAAAVQQPASVLFGRHTHFGKPDSVEQMQGLLLAKRPGAALRAAANLHINSQRQGTGTTGWGHGDQSLPISVPHPRSPVPHPASRIPHSRAITCIAPTCKP